MVIVFSFPETYCQRTMTICARRLSRGTLGHGHRLFLSQLLSVFRVKLHSRLSLPATEPPGPQKGFRRVSEGVSEGVSGGFLKGSLKGFRRGQQRTLLKPFENPSETASGTPSETLLKPFWGPGVL